MIFVEKGKFLCKIYLINSLFVQMNNLRCRLSLILNILFCHLRSASHRVHHHRLIKSQVDFRSKGCRFNHQNRFVFIQFNIISQQFSMNFSQNRDLTLLFHSFKDCHSYQASELSQLLVLNRITDIPVDKCAVEITPKELLASYFEPFV